MFSRAVARARRDPYSAHNRGQDLSRRYHPGPVTGGGGQDAVVPDEVDPGWRNECGELFEQLQRLEPDMGRAVAPALLELVDQPAVGRLRQTLGGQRETRGVAAQALEPTPVSRGYANVGVQADPVDDRAALRGVALAAWKP